MTRSDKIKNLTEYFAVVRQRPGMFLGANTISKLYDHLQGYLMAYCHNDFDNQIDKNFFDNFNDFVYQYYDIKTNDSWRGVILEQCFNNEQLALISFFELYDLFINDKTTINSRKIVLSFFDQLVFQQDSKQKLGDNFSSVLADTFELIKDNVITNYKSDFDDILEQLNEKAKQIPGLKLMLTEPTD